MAAAAEIDVGALIDEQRFGPYQIRIVVLCALVALLDGLDLQSMCWFHSSA